MPKPVYLMTVQEAHKEYNPLTDQIRAKYEQLDSGKYKITCLKVDMDEIDNSDK